MCDLPMGRVSSRNVDVVRKRYVFLTTDSVQFGSFDFMTRIGFTAFKENLSQNK